MYREKVPWIAILRAAYVPIHIVVRNACEHIAFADATFAPNAWSQVE
jgi:hypothetical protein